MKATGIVRRIDELGRVVIPKEIRRTLRIRVGDPLEIYTDRDGGVILKKYSPIGELGDFAKEYAEALYQSLGHLSIICDKDTVIAAAGPNKKEYLDKPISAEIEQLIANRERHMAQPPTEAAIRIVQDERDTSVYSAQLIFPISANGDTIGAVVLVSRESGVVFNKSEMKVCETASYFMGKQMEG
ncbi:MAG: stage V sporulation protein T [Clostridia bacterium]|nr:stage V sporulation protein T [Clostridia bacterium]